MINKPMLPPKKGYVEVEIDGQRVYKNVETGEIYGQETEKITAEEVLDAMLGVTENE